MYFINGLANDLLFATLNLHGFFYKYFKFDEQLLENWKQRVKINNNLGYLDLGSARFSNDIVLSLTDVMLSNNADDNKLLSRKTNIDKINIILTKAFKIVTTWLHENFVVLNFKKRHFTCIRKTGENETFALRDLLRKNSMEEVILVITNHKLTFDSHIKRWAKNLIVN